MLMIWHMHLLGLWEEGVTQFRTRIVSQNLPTEKRRAETTATLVESTRKKESANIVHMLMIWHMLLLGLREEGVTQFRTRIVSQNLPTQKVKS